MANRHRIAFLAVMLAAQCCAAAASPWTASKAATAGDLVEKFLRSEGDNAPPALSLALGLNGELVMAKGYGEAVHGQPADELTVYHIGSVTKQFTAAAVLDLVDRRAFAILSAKPLALESEVGAFFEGFDHWADQDGKPVTVRRLLNMTSNLPNITRRPPPNADPWGAIAAPELLGEIRKLSPHGWPDTFEYSNTSYFLLAEIHEAVIVPGERELKSYRERLQTFVFERAGMSSTGFIGAYAPASRVAEPRYRRRPAFTERDWLKGSADVASNAVDLHAWNKALMEGRILRQSKLALMFSEGGRVGPALWYGMGAFVEHTPERAAYTHSGSVPGFTAFNAIYRRNDGSDWASVSLLTNSDGVEGLNQLASDLGDLLLAD